MADIAETTGSRGLDLQRRGRRGQTGNDLRHVEALIATVAQIVIIPISRRAFCAMPKLPRPRVRMLAEKISRTKLAKSMMPAEGTIRSPYVRGDFGRSRVKGVCDSVGHQDVHEKRHGAAENYLLME